MKKIPANLHVAKISPLICRWNAKNVASKAPYVVIVYSTLPPSCLGTPSSVMCRMCRAGENILCTYGGFFSHWKNKLFWSLIICKSGLEIGRKWLYHLWSISKYRKKQSTYLLWNEAKSFSVLSVEKKKKGEHPPQNSQQLNGQGTCVGWSSQSLAVNWEMHLMNRLVCPPLLHQEKPSIRQFSDGSTGSQHFNHQEANPILKDIVSNPHRTQFWDEVAVTCHSLSRHKPSGQSLEGSILMSLPLLIWETQLFLCSSLYPLRTSMTEWY